MTRRRVVVVMPPLTDLAPADAIALWPTVTSTLEALAADGEVTPTAVCRSTHPGEIEHSGVRYVFEPTLAAMARAVSRLHPDVVHVHGLGFSRLILHLRQRLGRRVPILLQHHGERPPQTSSSRLAQRHVVRRLVDGYLFTGVAQAEPFRRIGVIAQTAPVFEVLESASLLVAGDGPAQPLSGSPSLLWVGRLIESKDPLCAVRAVAEVRGDVTIDAHLHMLATDGSLEAEVRKLAEQLGIAGAVHLHPPVDSEAMPRWYRGADIYVSTSRREGSNYSLIEALSFGCRPVVTDIAPHAAIVGSLAPRFTVGDHSAAALLAIAGEPLRAEVVAHSEDHLSWSAVVTQLTQAYRATVGT